mgnify:FL=1
MISDDIKRLKRLKRNLIPEKQEDCARFLRLAEGGAISYDRVGSSGSNENMQAQKNDEYVAACEELEELKAECTALMYHLTAEINSVFADDDEKRRIAKLHYVDGVTLNAIASKHMHYSYGCVKNKNAEIAAYLNL